MFSKFRLIDTVKYESDKNTDHFPDYFNKRNYYKLPVMSDLNQSGFNSITDICTTYCLCIVKSKLPLLQSILEVLSNLHCIPAIYGQDCLDICSICLKVKLLLMY